MTTAKMAANRHITGRQNRAAGRSFEALIDAACEHYKTTGAALIEKTPEPMRPIRRLNGGQFIACFTSQGQPDYMGTLRGGRAIVIEAKHTTADRIRRDVIREKQEAYLDIHSDMGADCYILADIQNRYYKIPWKHFRNMKRIYGRKYIKADELTEEGYEIHITGGVLKFLDDAT